MDDETELAKTIATRRSNRFEHNVRITTPRPDSPVAGPVTPYAYPVQQHLSMINEDYNDGSFYEFDPILPLDHKHHQDGMVLQSMDVITSMPQPSAGLGFNVITSNDEMPDGWFVAIPQNTDHLQFMFQVFNWSILYDQHNNHTGPLVIHDQSWNPSMNRVSRGQLQWRIKFLSTLVMQCPWPCVTSITYIPGNANRLVKIKMGKPVVHDASSSFTFAFSPWCTIPEFCTVNDSKVLCMTIGGFVPVQEIVDELEFVLLKVLYLLNSLKTSTNIPASVTSIDLMCYYGAEHIAEMIRSKRATLSDIHHVTHIGVFDSSSRDPNSWINIRLGDA